MRRLLKFIKKVWTGCWKAIFFTPQESLVRQKECCHQTDWASKSALMSSYCLYNINFYQEAVLNLERFIRIYPASPYISYAHYLIAISYYEQILDEDKDIQPLLVSKKKIEAYLEKFPDTDYAIDLKFKLDLVINQLAAKELLIASTI